MTEVNIPKVWIWWTGSNKELIITSYSPIKKKFWDGHLKCMSANPDAPAIPTTIHSPWSTKRNTPKLTPIVLLGPNLNFSIAFHSLHFIFSPFTRFHLEHKNWVQCHIPHLLQITVTFITLSHFILTYYSLIFLHLYFHKEMRMKKMTTTIIIATTIIIKWQQHYSIFLVVVIVVLWQ